MEEDEEEREAGEVGRDVGSLMNLFRFIFQRLKIQLFSCKCKCIEWPLTTSTCVISAKKCRRMSQKALLACKLLVQKTVVKMNEKEKSLLVGVEWKAFEFCPAIVNPLLFNQFLFVRIIEPINQLNGPLADSCNKTNLPH